MATLNNRAASFLIAAIAAGVSVSLFTSRALACGGGGITSHAGVTFDTQRVLISVRGTGTTDVVAQIDVPGSASDFGMLIPVPSEPTLDTQPVAAEDLTALDNNTAPSIRIFTASEEDEQDSGFCGSIQGTAVKGDIGGAGPVAPAVRASFPVEIGPVVAVSLTADNAEAISAWLEENHFNLPDADRSVLEKYVSPGSYFIAVRRSDNAVLDTPSSIGIHYSLKGDHRTLSLGFTRIGAARRISYTVFLGFGEVTAPSAPFDVLTLNDLDASTLRVSGYEEAVRKAVAEHESKAFVLENTLSARSLKEIAPKLVSLFDESATITRASTVVASDELAEDVMFRTRFSGEVPNSRFASLETAGPRRSRFAGLGVLMLGAALSVGLRRRASN